MDNTKDKMQTINTAGKIKELKADFEKLPCKDCEWRWSICCPKCDWNKEGKYNTY